MDICFPIELSRIVVSFDTLKMNCATNNFKKSKYDSVVLIFFFWIKTSLDHKKSQVFVRVCACVWAWTGRWLLHWSSGAQRRCHMSQAELTENIQWTTSSLSSGFPPPADTLSLCHSPWAMDWEFSSRQTHGFTVTRKEKQTFSHNNTNQNKNKLWRRDVFFTPESLRAASLSVSHPVPDGLEDARDLQNEVCFCYHGPRSGESATYSCCKSALNFLPLTFSLE